MLKIAIVEDEKAWEDTFRRYIIDFGTATKRVFDVTVFRDGMDFVSDFRGGGFDIILMDIAMPHMNGLDAAKKLREVDKNVCLIFITTLAQYAVKGYDVNAFDFLVKPVEYPLFEIKFAKAVGAVEAKADSVFVISGGGEMRKQPVGDIKYIESEKHYLFFHTDDGIFKMRGALDDIRDFFFGNGFVAINRSLIVNLAYVDGYTVGEVRVAGETLPLSRVYRAAFLDKLAVYLGGGV